MDIQPAIIALGYVRTAFDRVRKLQDENEKLTAVNDALSKLGEIQNKLYELREENAKLQAKVRDQTNELNERGEWRERRAAYKLVQAPGGAHVFKSEGPPEHFACPACMEEGKIQLLQDDRVAWAGTWTCPGCAKEFRVSASRHPVGAGAIQS